MCQVHILSAVSFKKNELPHFLIAWGGWFFASQCKLFYIVEQNCMRRRTDEIIKLKTVIFPTFSSFRAKQSLIRSSERFNLTNFLKVWKCSVQRTGGSIENAGFGSAEKFAHDGMKIWPHFCSHWTHFNSSKDVYSNSVPWIHWEMFLTCTKSLFYFSNLSCRWNILKTLVCYLLKTYAEFLNAHLYGLHLEFLNTFFFFV